MFKSDRYKSSELLVCRWKINVEEKICLAWVAEQAERFEDMVDYLEKVLAQKGGEVNAEERRLLSVAFKGLVRSKRVACDAISAIEQVPEYS